MRDGERHVATIWDQINCEGQPLTMGDRERNAVTPWN